jgi:DNA polymerase I-like protein with 3'-5' exonuclease and polymerase domains
MIYFVTNRTDNLVEECDGIEILYELRADLLSSTFYKSNFIGLDLETTGLRFNKDEILLIILGNDVDQVVIDWYSFKDSTDLSSFFNPKLLYIGHNLLFDLPFLMHRGVTFNNNQIYDTMIAEQVLIKGTKKSASLKTTLERRLKVTDVDKNIRMEFVAMKKHVPMFDNRHIKYAASDIKYLYDIRIKQLQFLHKYNQTKLTDLNNKNVVISSKMKVCGMQLDKEKWMGLYKPMTEYCDQLELKMDKQLEAVGLKQYKKRRKVRNEQHDLFGGFSKEVVNKNVKNINYASPKQVLEIFKLLELPIPKSAKEDKNSIGEATLQQYLIKYPDSILHEFLITLIEYKISIKLSKSFGKKWVEENLDENERVHPTFKVNSTATGRFSCIEENQLVMTVGGYKPIKNIKEGDYVYSYDDNGVLRINKVLNKFYQGYKKTIKINYSSQGRGSNGGSLICTPDHYIRVNTGEWKQAKDLTKKDKLWHLYRADNHLEGKSVRPRLYGVNSFMDKEQDTIKREFFGCGNNFHIHHIDFDSSNNRLENLAIMTPKGHSRYHALESNLGGSENGFKKGVKNPSHRGVVHNKILLEKYQVLRMIYATSCKPTKVIMDFQTFKNKCLEYKIDLNQVSKRFSNKGYLSKVIIKRALFKASTTEEASRMLGIGTRRLKELCKYYEIEYSNHRFISLEEGDFAHVYDLTIENNANFIVQELNVHNCADPNLQQIPSNVNYRQCFVAPKGRKLWTCDYSSAELRILASLSRDQTMLNILSSGGDLHGYAATPIYRYLYKDPRAIVDKHNHGEFRSRMKNVIFGLLYGAGVGKIAELLDIDSYKAQKSYDILVKTFPDAFDYLEKMSRFGVMNGYIVVDEKLYQRRWFEEFFDGSGYLNKRERSMIERRSKNTPIQATNGQMMKLALVYVDDYITKNKLGSRIVSTVHDEMVVEVGEGEEGHVETFKYLMKVAGDEFLDGVEMDVEDKLLEYWSK